MSALAVFDFDGTVVKGDAGVEFGRHVLALGYLHAFNDGAVKGALRIARLNANTVHLALKGIVLHARYAAGDVDRHEMVERAYASFRGLDGDWVRGEMDRYARGWLPRRVRKDTLERMRDHQDQGDHIVVVSTGVRDLIWPLRDVLDIDFEVVACRLRETNGSLTGTVEDPLNGNEKATRVLAIAKRRGHDLTRAWAYTDHEDDAVILEMVGNPVVVHPTRSMRKLADEKGWPLLH